MGRIRQRDGEDGISDVGAPDDAHAEPAPDGHGLARLISQIYEY